MMFLDDDVILDGQYCEEILKVFLENQELSPQVVGLKILRNHHSDKEFIGFFDYL